MISDDRGMLNLPFKLVVAMAIVAAMAPVVADMVDFAEDEISVEGAKHEAHKLENTIQGLYYKSIGTRTTVALDIPRGNDLAIGGSTTEEQYSIRIIRNGEVIDSGIITAPSVRVVSAETIFSGSVNVTLARTTDGVEVVEC